MMNVPERPDEIDLALDKILSDFYNPPTEMDLRGVDIRRAALGLSYGFDSWQEVRVVANSRHYVASAARHWSETHPSDEFLTHAIGADERALGHRQLLDRAHPDCVVCGERRRRLSGGDLDHIDFDLEWHLFQQTADSLRSGRSGTADNPPNANDELELQATGSDAEVLAKLQADGEWQIVVRHPSARHITLQIRWSSGETLSYEATFRNRKAFMTISAPERQSHPDRVSVVSTDAN